MDDPTPTVPEGNNNEVVSTQPSAVPASEPISPLLNTDQSNNNLPSNVGPGDNPQITPKTDVLGIISIVLAFIFTFAGLIVGIVGIFQAKKENRKATLSVIGTILNALFMLGSIAFLVFFFVLASKVEDTSSKTQDLFNKGANISNGSVEGGNIDFILADEYQLASVCEGSGWPSNVTATSGTNKIYSIQSESTTYPGSFSSSSFVNPADGFGYNSDKPTMLDRVVCMSTTDQETISQVPCKFESDGVETTAIMNRKNYLATVYDVVSRSVVGTFEVSPTEDCPYFVSIDADNTFVAYPDSEDGEAKIAAFDSNN